MLNKIQYCIKIKDLIIKNLKNLSWLIFLIFLAFSLGNLFGISTKNVNSFYLCSFLIIIEFISFLKYSKIFQEFKKFLIQSHRSLVALQQARSALASSMQVRRTLDWRLSRNFIINTLNVLKRGFLIGIFIEAFKVGS